MCLFTRVFLWAVYSSLLNRHFHVVAVQLLSRVPLFPAPWTAAHQASLSFTNSQSLLKLMSIEWVMPYSHLILCIPFSSWHTVDNQCSLKERFCRGSQLGQEWFRGGRKFRAWKPSWGACPPSPLQGRPQYPQHARGSSLNGCRCRLICLGLWLSRKAGQSKTTGRKAWLLAEVCGRQDGPWADAWGLEG